MISNYWQNVSWTGICYPPVSGAYKINLNSQKVNTDSESELIATHEVCHAFGLTDCSTYDDLMYFQTGSSKEIADYEDNLFINRYGRY